MDLHEIYYNFPKEYPLPMVLDGAMGTRLIAKGMPEGVCAEKWILENPEKAIEVQSGYYNDGSDVVYAPTFGGNRAALSRYGYGDMVGEFNCKLVKLSKSINGGLVAGDMAPTGMFVVPYGTSKFEDLVSVFEEQARALDEAGVDYFAVETMMTLSELRAAVVGIKRVSDKPIFATLTVDNTGRTLWGDRVDAALLTLADLGVNAFGCNCSMGPDGMLKTLAPVAPLAASLGIPLIAKPNAGLPQKDENGRSVYKMSAEDFGKDIEALLNAGIFIVGGCCGTNDDHIKAASEKVRAFDSVPEFEKIDTQCLACTNNKVVRVDADCLEMYAADDELLEADGECVLVNIFSNEDADFIISNYEQIQMPLAVCGDYDAIAYLRERYNGKLIVL